MKETGEYDDSDIENWQTPPETDWIDEDFELETKDVKKGKS